MEAFFYLTALLCCYSYFLYPLILGRLPRRVPAAASGGEELPVLTLIITVHNEAARIREKLNNSLEIDYPGDRLEIIVASDGSTDDTEDIAAEFADRGVRLG